MTSSSKPRSRIRLFRHRPIGPVRSILALLVIVGTTAPVLMAVDGRGGSDSGAVVATLGKAWRIRGSERQPLTRLSGIRLGDMLATGPAAGALAYWNGGLVVCLGENTEVFIGQRGSQPVLKLISGQARVTADLPIGLDIQVGGTITRLKRGTLRVANSGEQVVIHVEHTVADCLVRRRLVDLRTGIVLASVDDATTRLKTGDQVVVNDTDRIATPADSGQVRWTLQPQRLQVLTVAQASRAQRGQPKSSTGKKLPKKSDKKKSDKKKSDKKKSDKKKSDKKKSDKKKSDPKKTDEPTTRGIAGGEDEDVLELLRVSSSAQSKTTGFGTINLSLGTPLASSAAGSAGGLFTDANQNTIVGQLGTFDSLGNFTASSDPAESFPGNIHPVTGQTRYTLFDVDLDLADGFPISTQFWSIGEGAQPTGQVTTAIGTGTGVTPDVIAIPQFDAYLIRLDQYGIVDPASDAAEGNQTVAISGLLGLDPSNPLIQGLETPLADERSLFNDLMTFSVGELTISRDGDHPEFSVRRSDQDRLIVKDSGGNANNDQVEKNPDVTFEDVADPLFFPSNPTVKVPTRGPDSMSRRPTYRQLGFLRKAAVTTLMARELAGFARRTGQTRFVVDGKILDITGYRGP